MIFDFDFDFDFDFCFVLLYFLYYYFSLFFLKKKEIINKTLTSIQTKGHSIGLDVHDPGSIETLEPDMIVTVEPGIYFNRAFFGLATPKQLVHIDMPRVNAFLNQNFGGVRFEDVMLITATGSENLTPGVHLP